jgi:hypothetical protein
MPLKESLSSKYGGKEKRLPPNFHEAVLELELLIDNDKFDLKTVEQLLYLYSVLLNMQI